MLRTLACAVAIALSGCATAKDDEDADFTAMFSGTAPHAVLSSAEQAAVDRLPLGSEGNPVRAQMPAGEREYLSRLRCPDGTPPTFERLGSVGLSPYGAIMDVYSVQCGTAAPVEVYIDMYHAGYIEKRPVEGFSISSDGA